MATSLQVHDSPAAWKGSALDWQAEALHRLSADQVAEIDGALDHLKSLGDLDIPDITRDTFPLKATGHYLRDLRHELQTGRGFLLLRGLPRERYSPDDLARIYVGLGVHIGQPVAQSHRGELLGSVVDVSDIVEKPRGYRAGGQQGFHSDGTACDVIGLMCLRRAKVGGKSRIVSSVSLYNALVERRPDLAQVLCRGLPLRMHGPDAELSLSPGHTGGRPAPIFSFESGDFSCHMDAGNWLYAIKAGDTVASAIELEAYETLQKFAASDEFHLDMTIDEGDIQFINNRKILHSRLDYDDHDELARRRYMLRLWLEITEWQPWPPDQRLITFDDARHFLRQRKPRMDFPSFYMGEMERLYAQRRLEGAAMIRKKPFNRFAPA
ncbi:MAG: TauD/TfdA family dioxygenase [Rhizomicrobium sp.]